MQVKKYTLGLRSTTKQFKISSEWGAIIDDILDERGKELSEDYYTRVGETEQQGLVTLLNDRLGNMLTIDREGIVLTKNGYMADKRVDIDQAFKEFQKVWSIVNKTLSIREFKRIGMVVEYRFKEQENSSLDLIRTLTKLPPPAHPANFFLRFEARQMPNKGGLPLDVNKSDYVNLITDYYDSGIDADKSERGAINANLDFQHYYAPPIARKNIGQEMESHFFRFKKELASFEKQIHTLGLVQDGK